MNSQTRKVVHISTVHTRYDMRIYKKMCCSLSEYGFDVTFLVADGNGDEVLDGVSIVDMRPEGKETNRFRRMLFALVKTFKKAKSFNADLYHLHDPELIPLGLMLRASGYKVVFDAHEDLPKQILTKNYLNPVAAKLISKLVYGFEFIAFRFFTSLVGATPSITDKLKQINKNSFVINNFAILGELASKVENSTRLKRDVVFVGGMTEIRGIEQLVAASKSFEGKLHLVGEFAPSSFGTYLKEKYSFENIQEHGFLDREGVAAILASCAAGFVTYLPCPNHVEAQPNKLFEYMSAGLPVIASNYPLWQDIVIKNNCGICLNPESEQELIDAVKQIVLSPEQQREFGINGAKAVEQKYNWQEESQNLLLMYKKFI